MDLQFLAVLLCLAVFRKSDAATPVITDGNMQTKSIDEGATGTAFTLTSSVAALYTLSGTDASYFSVAPTTGGTAGTTATVTITTAPDYQSKSSYSFNVVATASSGGEVTTVAITLNVVNKSPGFASAGYSVCLEDGSGAGTSVVTATATAINTGVTIEYSISSGNMGMTFAIGTTTGAITVDTGKTVSSSTYAGFALVLHAIDTGTPAQTGTGTVIIKVGGCSGGTSLIAGSVSIIFALVVCLIQRYF